MDQMQLDVYGEIIDTLHAAREADLAVLQDAWRLQKVLLSHLEGCWDQPDQGIWEVRGGPRHFTHSRLMCWVAFDRAIKSHEHFGLEGPVDRWREVRDTIHADICRNGFDRGQNSFVQSYGATALDASLLLIPQTGFPPAHDPRVAGTIAAVEKELLVDGFVLRYATDRVDDGVGGREGAFPACSFWLCDAYVLQGRTEEATALFERLLSLRNDLGLLAEEYDPMHGRQVGNFPQGFSHISLVNTAFNLANVRGPARQRSEARAPNPAPTGALN